MILRDIDYPNLHNVLLLSKNTVRHDYSIAVLTPNVLEEYFQKNTSTYIKQASDAFAAQLRAGSFHVDFSR